MLWQARYGMICGRGALDGPPAGDDSLAMAFVTSTSAAAIGSTTKTFSSVSIRGAASTRVVVAAIIGQLASGSSTITSVTIGGVTATQASFIENTGQPEITSIWYAAVPSGTTANIDIVTSVNMTNIAIAAYRLAGLSSNTPTHTNTAQATQSSALSCNTNVSANGFLITAAGLLLGSTATFTGVTQDAVQAPGGTSRFYVASFTEGGAGETPRTIHVTPSSTDSLAIATASWR